MTDRERLAELRDQALRDLVELESQVRDGEVSPSIAAGLRARYEAAAARAMAALTAPEVGSDVVEAPSRRWSSRGRLLAYGLTAAAAVLAAALLPGYVGVRPAGGAVTGNEVLQQARADAGAAGAAPGADLSRVSDEEMEAVVAANPEVIGMRLALADRYLEAGRYPEAAAHYRRALAREPDNPDVQAHYGWLLLHLNRPQEAVAYVDRALAQDPNLVDGLWFKSNIALYGQADPRAALDMLDALAARPDLSPTVRQQVDALAQVARDRLGGTGG